MEIRNVANMLREQGKQAFFIRLEHIPNDFEDAFEVGTFEDFKEWLASGEEGWYLLDSVNEARLRNPGDFELAIRKLGRRISTAKDRTHIVITGRRQYGGQRRTLTAVSITTPAPLTAMPQRLRPMYSDGDQGK